MLLISCRRTRRDAALGDRLAARIDHGIKVGCVCITNGWWLTDGAAVNQLSAARETDMGHGAAFHENRVQVEAPRGGR